jgi:hypothetical protein
VKKVYKHARRLARIIAACYYEKPYRNFVCDKSRTSSLIDVWMGYRQACVIMHGRKLGKKLDSIYVKAMEEARNDT